jgi:LmbE family N-acetylglucosaminyl deacetylase
MVILGIGAHPDDVEIGCGGSLALHSQKGDEVHIVTFSFGERGGAEANIRQVEAEAAAKIIGAKSFTCFKYPDTNIPFDREAVEKLEKIIEKINPNRVFIPYHREIHQDHVNTNKISLVACRNVLQILMYEGPSTYTNFQASYWIDIGKTLEAKVSSIACHKSQGAKELMKIEAITGMNRFRGFQVRTEYAEGFAIFRFVE